VERVAWRNLQRFSMNIKVGHKFDQGRLEAEFGKSKFSEPRLWLGKMVVEFFSTLLKILILSSY
jgi:hypothetical protein